MSLPLSKTEEWRAHWPLVLAAMVGFGFNSLASYSTGLFVEPLEKEFGWTRALISAGSAIGAGISVLLSAPVGALIDKWGARRIALPGLALAGCSFAAFGLATGAPWQWLGLWCAYALIALTTKSTIWVYSVSSVFVSGRSLALAFALGGSALAQILAPLLTFALIEEFGWRGAFAGLGLGWGVVALILCIVFLHDGRSLSLARAPTAQAPKVEPPSGLTLRQAFRTPALIRIGLATLITMFVGVAAMAHQVPILSALGIDRGDAAAIASLSGVAAIAGKLVTGWAMDRYSADWVGSLTLMVSGVAFALLLLFPTDVAMIVTAMLIIGYSGGTKLQVCAYLTGQHSGMRHFGAIFGVMSSLVALGSALGPMAAGYTFDVTRSYGLFMLFATPASVVSGLLIFRLGASPDWSAGTDQPSLTPSLD